MNSIKNNSIFDVIEAGLKAENLRQKAIASNIANLQSHGYRRVDVKFRETLAKAMDKSGNIDLGKVKAELHHPMNTPVNENGNDVSLEHEVGQMVKNSLRHKTYVRLLAKKYKQISMAISTR